MLEVCVSEQIDVVLEAYEGRLSHSVVLRNCVCIAHRGDSVCSDEPIDKDPDQDYRGRDQQYWGSDFAPLNSTPRL